MIKRYLTSLVYGLSIGLFCSFSAMATVCFLPDGSCGGVNYGYKDESGSTCTYKTRDEANLKKGECETVQKQGFCFYLSCSMSKSDCDKAAANAPNHDKCCVPCGNCWKVADCSIPQIETCTGANYETEQTCKNKNQNFKPNGKFDKNGTACGECKDVPYITCPEMGDDYVTRAECTAKGSSFTFASADVKDSDGNECGTCSESEPETCTSGYSTAYQSQADCQSGETFSQNGTANGKVCGKCTKVIDTSCKDYTLTSAKDSNCYSCSTCPTDSSKYKCTESVKSGYQLVGNSCVNKCSDYTLTSKKDENCYSCTPCPYDSSKYKCTENVKSGYQLVNGVCSKKPENKILTCEEWIKEKYDEYTIYNGTQSSLSTSYLAILASGRVAIPRTGVMRFVGPKYFNYEECQKLATPTITITNTTQGLVNAYKINMIFDVDMSKNTSISAAIQPNVTSGQSMTISDASISAPGGVIRLRNFAKLLLEGNTSIKTDCHYIPMEYGCRAIDTFERKGSPSSTVFTEVTVVTGSNVSITGTLLVAHDARLTVEKNATINITKKGPDEALSVDMSGFTPAYYADTGVHNYGILKTDSFGPFAGQVNCYSGSKFSTSEIYISSSRNPGRIKYEKQTNIKIGGTCKTPSYAGEYEFKSPTTSNPISGSSCSF